MTNTKLQDSLENLQRAVIKLESALNTPRERELVLEGTIQRFEFVMELFWKTLKRALEFEGIQSKTPRECLKAAYAAGWLNSEDAWLALLDLRNSTSHLYLHPDLLDNHYDEIKRRFPELQATFAVLKPRYG